jgi:hypothetical protein
MSGLYGTLQRHMHGVDVGFGEDGGGGGNNWGNENLTSLAQLTDMTSFSIPVNIADHTGPPKALTDVSFGSVECFVSKRVVCDADDGKSSTWWDYSFVSAV